MRNKACERCGDFSATQMVGGEDLCVECACVECANRASRQQAAARRASSLGIDYDELALGVEERDAELVLLTADLAEARADVQRFEAQLDASNRELAQARAERDEAVRRRDFAKEGEDNMRYLKQLWEQECGFYLAKSNLFQHQVERDRRTIRALVVAARGMYYALLRAMIRYESADETPEQTERRLRNATTRIKFGMMRTKEVEQAENSGQQAGE